MGLKRCRGKPEARRQGNFPCLFSLTELLSDCGVAFRKVATSKGEDRKIILKENGVMQILVCTTSVREKGGQLVSIAIEQRWYLKREKKCETLSLSTSSLTLSILPVKENPSLFPSHSLLTQVKMMLNKALLAIVSLALVSASPFSEKATCSSYTLISTRGTAERQGPHTASFTFGLS